MPYTDLVAKKIGQCDGRTVWELDRDLEWMNGVTKIIVPKGFQCDFCSVPRLPLVWLMVGAIGEVAGTVHDYLYRRGAQLLEGNYREPTREEADNIFYNILGEEGVSWWKRKAMYYAVRVGAGKNWHARKVSEPFIKQEVWL